MHINGPEQGKLSKAIQSAFPNQMNLGSAIRNQLDDDLNSYLLSWGTYADAVNEMITQYNARYQICLLVSGLLNEKPTNEKLLEFAWRHQIVKRSNAGALGAEDGSLERMLEPTRGFTDVGQLLQRMGQVSNATCQISCPTEKGTEFGTGFLIGNSTVLTNWHVIRHVNSTNRQQVKLLFDYRTAGDGSFISPGVPFQLVDRDDWLIDSSEFQSGEDSTIRPVEDDRKLDRDLDKLDYAVLRVAREPGANPVGAKQSATGNPRGCLPLSEVVDVPSELDSMIWCFQHPYENQQIQPLQCDANKPGLLGVNPNRTRVWYTVNTRPGSSGSPVLTGKLQLCALHHAGGKDWPKPTPYLYNRGIPLVTIRSLLEKRGKLGEIK